ncbi:hypothetical protein AN958_03162, partial [Leucoagaricus sp. SymC.cos]
IGNNTPIAITLPTIGQEFNADPSLLQWFVAAYPLSSGCLLLVCGRLADLYGRKKAYLLGTLMTAAFSLGVGFANNITTLIILRAMQGIGAATTVTASLGILATSFPPSRTRSLAFATFNAGAPIGAVFGSAVGGVLTEKTAPTWRSVFYVFTGINVICMLGGMLSIDKDVSNTAEEKKVDWLGAFLITAGLVLILFVLGEGETKGWATGYIIALLVIGVLLVCIFVYWQWFLEQAVNRRHAKAEVVSSDESQETEREKGLVGRLVDRWCNKLPPPVMKLSIWARANGRFSAVMVMAVLDCSAFFAWTFWVQLYYQDYTHLKPLEVVVRLLPMSVTGVLCTAFVGLMAAYIPMIVISLAGTLGTAGACILFAVINPKTTYWAFGFPATVLSVFGADLIFAAGSLYIAKIALPHEQSLAAALFQTMVQLGTSLGVTISTVVFDRVSLSLAQGEDNIRAYRAAQWTTTAFGLAASLLVLVAFRGVGVPGDLKQKSDPPKDEEEPRTSSPDGKTEED